MPSLPSNFVVFTGNANRGMAEEIAQYLGTTLGDADVGRFSDGEVTVEIKQNVRTRNVFIVQPTCAPTNDNLMELLVMVDALKRASAESICAVIPYFGYARQDRRVRSSRVPITAKVVANMLQAAGVSRVLTMDLHADQIQGFFDIPVDHLSSEIAFTRHFRQLRPSEDLVVVSPDTGSVHRIRRFANRLEAPLAIVDKRRPKANVSEVMNLIGEVKDRHALIFDDLIDTGGTLVKAAEAIKARGAIDVTACATHAVFSGKAVDRIYNSVLEEVWVSDSIPLSEEAAACPKIKVLSIAPLIG